jgi:membrane protein CcdC involved in cytochrome C biogenesis
MIDGCRIWRLFSDIISFIHDLFITMGIKVVRIVSPNKSVQIFGMLLRAFFKSLVFVNYCVGVEIVALPFSSELLEIRAVGRLPKK